MLHSDAVLFTGLAVLLLDGCARQRTYYEPPPLTDVVFTARAELTGARRDSIRIRAVGINTSRETRRIEYGTSCSMSARAALAASTSREKPRSWEYFAMETGRAEIAHMYFACTTGLISFLLQPGGSTALQLDFSVLDVLGDSLPAGVYQFTAVVAVSGLKNRALPAGELSLGAPSSNR